MSRASRWETHVGCTWPECLRFPRARSWFCLFHGRAYSYEEAKPPFTRVRQNGKEDAKQQPYTTANFSGVTRRWNSVQRVRLFAEAAQRAATLFCPGRCCDLEHDAKEGAGEGREGVTDYGTVPSPAPVFSVQRVRLFAEAAQRAATLFCPGRCCDLEHDAKEGAGEGREGVTDYGTVPEHAPVFSCWLATGHGCSDARTTSASGRGSDKARMQRCAHDERERSGQRQGTDAAMRARRARAVGAATRHGCSDARTTSASGRGSDKARRRGALRAAPLLACVRALLLLARVFCALLASCCGCFRLLYQLRSAFTLRRCLYLSLLKTKKPEIIWPAWAGIVARLLLARRDAWELEEGPARRVRVPGWETLAGLLADLGRLIVGTGFLFCEKRTFDLGGEDPRAVWAAFAVPEPRARRCEWAR